ncbi:MAG: glycosyltransferase family 4 protein [Candidatus Omnitrophota bacterium]
MKMLNIIHCFPPESMSGSEIYAYNLSKELSKSHDISIFYRINDRSRKNYELVKGNYDGLSVYKVNNILNRYTTLENIYKNKNIEDIFIKVLDEVKPDIVHIHHLLFLSLGIIDIIKERNIPIVFTLHDYWLMCPRGQLLKPNSRLCSDPVNSNCLYCLISGMSPSNISRKIFTFSIPRKISKRYNVELSEVFDKVDLFIAPSKFLRNRFIELGMPQGKIRYSDYGMNADLFKDIKKTLSDKVRFGFIGTLIPTKGVHVAIKAFNKIEESNVMLKIYGKPPVNNGIFSYYKKIKRIVRGNKNIYFMGSFDNKDIAKVFKDIDVLIFPSMWEENSPLILHEAILSNTPILASKVGGVSELIKDSFFLFERGNVEELYNKIKFFIDNSDKLNEHNPAVTTVKDIKEDAVEIEKIYSLLVKRQETIDSKVLTKIL